ncbi:MAG: phosphoenolpyruvate carboxylase, partial [Planctomycetia bacterium]
MRDRHAFAARVASQARIRFVHCPPRPSHPLPCPTRPLRWPTTTCCVAPSDCSATCWAGSSSISPAGDALALIEEIRTLSRDRRAGRHDAERALAARIESLDTAQAECVARAFSVYFDLVNIAEDRQRVRVLRERE